MSEEVKSEKPSLIGMITSPGEQFEKVKERPIIWGPLVIVTIIFMIGTWLQSIGIEVTDFIELTAEEQVVVEQITTITMIITAIIMPIIIVLITSAILMLLAKIAKSDVRFKQLFSMNTFILFISAIGTVLNGILFALFGGGEGALYTSIGTYMNAEGAMAGLLDSIEIFAIWVVVLTAIGLEKVANLSKGFAWGIAIAFFVITVLFAMFGAAVGAGLDSL